MRLLSRRTFSQGLSGTLFTLALTEARPSSRNVATSLFDPVTLGSLQLPNRTVMAPLTRGRAGQQRTANTLMAEYYAQRADAGLIVAEATAISSQGYGWLGSPAIYTEAHVAGWREVTLAVHQRRGRIVLQLWHTGRVSHPDFLAGGTPIGPSAIAADGETHTPLGKKPYVRPRAMTTEDIVLTIGEYAQAARFAKDAGFDGVEIHAGNGYLIDQFIRDGSNKRTDAYGGSLQKRLRFLFEVTEAVTRAWSADRVGVRLSPTNPYNDMTDSHPAQTFTAAAKILSQFYLAYLHVIDVMNDPAPEGRIAPLMRESFNGPFILNGGYDAQTGTAALRAGEADLVAYGRFYLANPDLVERFREGTPLNEPDVHTFYTGGARGYIDYPTFKAAPSS
jgi:N-ethylmaleimide reductase